MEATCPPPQEKVGWLQTARRYNPRRCNFRKRTAKTNSFNNGFCRTARIENDISEELQGRPWRWRSQVSPKRWCLPNSLWGFNSRKTKSTRAELIKHYAMWMYRSTFSWPCHWLEVSGELHAPATLPPRKELPVPIGHEAEWAPELVWTTRRKCLPLSGLELRPLSCLARSQSLYGPSYPDFTPRRHYSS
jgi:hypothetical protein